MVKQKMMNSTKEIVIHFLISAKRQQHNINRALKNQKGFFVVVAAVILSKQCGSKTNAVLYGLSLCLFLQYKNDI